MIDRPIDTLATETVPTKLPAKAFVIEGGRPLQGEVTINRAKNSALYLILASLLTPEPVVLRNVPRLSDVLVLLDMLRHFGVSVQWQGRDLHLQANDVHCTHAPYAMVSKMRASFVAMGALLGRRGNARMSMPGGCAFGPRPVDRHIKAFRQLGAHIREDAGDFYVWLEQPLEGTAVFEAPTVGGTQNILLASALGSKRVVIENAALEPEVEDLVTMLNTMGARIRGAGTARLEVDGVASLRGIDYEAIADRIEAGTFMLAAAATRGNVTLQGVVPDHLRAVTSTLQACGVEIYETATSLELDARGDLVPSNISASEYPGLPTDLQAPFGAFLATIAGTSVVTDRVYPDRFTHVAELKRAGANLDMHDRTLIIQGAELQGTTMHAADIRAGGALIVAALAAQGLSIVSGVQYIERGYEDLATRLAQLGATISLQKPLPDEDIQKVPELTTLKDSTLGEVVASEPAIRAAIN
jgi:UDP-N-acetylglucosamine 1-carboxyvinyltransferase